MRQHGAAFGYMRNLMGCIGMLLVAGCTNFTAHNGESNSSVNLAAAEAFVDAFYSFDSGRLDSVLSFAELSKPEILYYQGWAQGGHYTILKRSPCNADRRDSFSCSVTVEDDLMRALQIDFNVTDTFHLTISDGRITAVKTSSNDLPIFYEAEEWVRRERSELVRGPCMGYFAGGPTPQACARAMVSGYAEFTAQRKSED